MERIILLPTRARSQRPFSRKLLRRRTEPRPVLQKDGTLDVSEVVTVVLGGGRGNRLFPLTSGRAKPAVPVGGKYRLVDIALSNSLNSGVNRIFLLTQFNSASLHAHVSTTYRFDHFTKGFVEILAAEQTEQCQDWYQGTADAVRKQIARIKATRAKEVVILSGDHLYDIDLRQFIARHREARADVTIAVTPCPREDAPQFGLLRVDPDDMITEFAEKPKDPAVIDRFSVPGRDGDPRVLASMGIYVFRMDVLEALLRGEGTDFGNHVLPRAIRERPVAAYRFEGYWEDLGTIASYHRANVGLACANPRYSFFGCEHPVYTRPRALPASRIEGARLTHALVSDGCRIEDNVALIRSVVGNRSIIRRDTRVEDTVIFGLGNYEPEDVGGIRQGVGERCSIENAILDRDVRIGNDVILENRERHVNHDGPLLCVRDGIIIVPRGTTIPHGFVF